jgi:hypothetical protein
MSGLRDKTKPKCVHFNERGRDMYGKPGRKKRRVLDQSKATYLFSDKSHHSHQLHHKNMGKCPYCKEAIRLQHILKGYVWKLPRHKDVNTGKQCRGSECRPYGQTPKKFKNGEIGRTRGEDQWITIKAWKCPSGHWANRRVKLNVPGHPEFGWDPATIKNPPKKKNKIFKADPIAWAARPSGKSRNDPLKESLKLYSEPKDEPPAAGCDGHSESVPPVPESFRNDEDPL